jgi:hypothetical protein
VATRQLVFPLECVELGLDRILGSLAGDGHHRVGEAIP